MGASPGQLVHPTEVQRTKEKGGLGQGWKALKVNSKRMESTKPSLAEVGWSQVLGMQLGVET